MIQTHFGLEKFEELKKENYEVDCIEKTSIGDNIEGYKVHEWIQATGVCNYFAKQGVETINISRDGNGLTYPYCEDDPLFNQMLSTFRFLK